MTPNRTPKDKALNAAGTILGVLLVILAIALVGSLGIAGIVKLWGWIL